MKKFTVILGFVLSFIAMHGQEPQFRQLSPKAKPGVDYPIKVHVSSSQIRPRCGGGGDNISCADLLYAEAVVNGRKLELAGDKIGDLKKAGILVPGDYRARLTRDEHNADSTVIYQEYELVLSDKTLWRCTLTRISE